MMANDGAPQVCGGSAPPPQIAMREFRPQSGAADHPLVDIQPDPDDGGVPGV